MTARDSRDTIKMKIRSSVESALINLQSNSKIGNCYFTEKELIVFKDKHQFQVKITSNNKANYFGDSIDITETFRTIDGDKRDLNYGIIQNLTFADSTLRLAHVGSYEFVLKDMKNQEYTVKVSTIREPTS